MHDVLQSVTWASQAHCRRDPGMFQAQLLTLKSLHRR